MPSRKIWDRRVIVVTFAPAWLGALVALALASTPAGAVPAFAVQTAQPCQACHVGGFGPQLTPYGRNFKLRGYTQRATAFNFPIAAMAVASYVQTAKDQPSPPASGFHTNDNSALDQVSLFLAGGFGAHVGAFVQATYDGVARTFAWDNVDLRLTTTTQVRDRDLVLGVSLNNSPGVQDPWNTLPAWSFPYTDSALAPAPAASLLISGSLAQTTLGATGYAWINSELYLEAGGYGSPGATALRRLGADPFSPGDIDGLAPYARIAWQKTVGGGVAEIGAVALHARLHPGMDRSTSLTDRYTDLGLDASYQRTLGHGDVLTVDSRYVHERQRLDATCALAASEDPGCARATLNDLRLNASYYWRDRVGLTLGAFDTFGSANPVLYPDHRSFKPDSSGLTLQLDGTPWGAASQPARRLNMRVGLQYTHYLRFDGARRAFDGAGRNASDNDTLRLFTWFAF
ncbi:cytochrome C [Phenylobacterium hankyongense]|uniref:Cytochrome C n=1 Tax=Phenylobacterium hankyongense TaxID=1813876 RepID=A0A328B0V4_9CAUL|nr:cytochrome C [Phenylobacterium hankyongense]RAK60195.1 cytochrome C [Phenylobacterium hankyongense]